MRSIVMSILALAICSLNLLPAPAATDLKPAEPSEKQLEAAKEAYAKFGAKYAADTNPKTEQTVHLFRMPKTTTDADLKGLPDLPFSFGLGLISTQVTDAGLKELKELKQLTTLDLEGTQVTDAGLKELKELKQLAELNLSRTKVTDAGLKELKELKQLTTLNLEGTQVTDAGLKGLKEALPNCEIRNK